ncbi:MAG: sulfatase [Chloroflexota bacterium]
MYKIPLLVLFAWLLLLASTAPVAAECLGGTTSQLAVATEARAPEGGPSNAQTVEVQPDIFVVLVDDLGFLPDQRVLERLPNIREVFLENGTRFTQMHNETPLCGPARAGLLSGQNTLRHGVIGNDGNALDLSRTLPLALDDVGYQTVMVGKLLNRWKGTRTPPGWDNVAMAKGAYRSAYWRNGELTSYRPMFIDEANRVQVVEWTEQAPPDAPLFLLASMRAPHVDQCVNEKGVTCYTPRVMERDIGAAECAGIPDFKPPSYSLERRTGPAQDMPDWPDGWKLVDVCESLLVIDRMVGDIVEAQSERGRPAWFIFMSDNGMSWGQHGNPFKRVPWSTQMPMYISGPGVGQGETDALLSLIDIPVTIADIAGAEMPWADGRSFLPLLQGEGEGRSEVLEVMPGSWSGLRTADRHYIRWDSGDVELYAYRDDPWHLDDLSDAEPEVVAQMDLRLDELLLASQAE